MFRDRVTRWHWGQKILAGIAVCLAVVILLNPEIAALGLLMDAAFVDLLALLISLQLQQWGVTLRLLIRSAGAMCGRVWNLLSWNSASRGRSNRSSTRGVSDG